MDYEAATEFALSYMNLVGKNYLRHQFDKIQSFGDPNEITLFDVIERITGRFVSERQMKRTIDFGDFTDEELKQAYENTFKVLRRYVHETYQTSVIGNSNPMTEINPKI